ncbi:expressed unknown protein [Seminavis robusta]|uniref:Uncharacterized protein n=1 Tax=Seminavis robusta TaxID=568900 RepID=A0A9N8GZ85_9STRA|nr:expressed unknown protein [Seminavis robusta]|eukprot:Sro1_g000070.1 n/a (229) ;mRNA; f:23344-24030
MIPEYIFLPDNATSHDASDETPSSSGSTHNDTTAPSEAERWNPTEVTTPHAAKDVSPKAPSRPCQDASCPKLPERRGSFRTDDDGDTMPPKMPRRVDSVASFSKWNNSSNTMNLSSHHMSFCSNHDSHNLSHSNNNMSVQQMSDPGSPYRLQSLPSANLAIISDLGPLRVSSNAMPRSIDILSDSSRTYHSSSKDKSLVRGGSPTKSSPTPSITQLTRSPTRDLYLHR